MMLHGSLWYLNASCLSKMKEMLLMTNYILIVLFTRQTLRIITKKHRLRNFEEILDLSEMTLSTLYLIWSSLNWDHRLSIGLSGEEVERSMLEKRMITVSIILSLFDLDCFCSFCSNVNTVY